MKEAPDLLSVGLNKGLYNCVVQVHVDRDVNQNMYCREDLLFVSGLQRV